MAGPNLRALNRTIRSLTLTDADQARVALAKALAAAVDADPCPDCGAGRTAALWKEYRAALTDLMLAGATDDADDETARFLSIVRTPVRAEVGDTA